MGRRLTGILARANEMRIQSIVSQFGNLRKNPDGTITIDFDAVNSVLARQNAAGNEAFVKKVKEIAEGK